MSKEPLDTGRAGILNSKTFFRSVYKCFKVKQQSKEAAHTCGQDGDERSAADGDVRGADGREYAHLCRANCLAGGQHHLPGAAQA